ncbi:MULTISPECIES: rhodanese-like domain-containing protein [Methylomicrobium]|uniref:Rhodanese-related sulfurtransferase n=1 Tax=Methylomicrobium album BG8 TaxID=686340 RepID=H8GMP5_METAL|nr:MULTISPECIES: rhodanese-like domain-containing protein [Methylomicrobium]EIC28285.1 Rhodanese-related sulfurtransferase [Methylomicrobium album BG8]
MIKNTANTLLLAMMLVAPLGLADAAEHGGKPAPAAKPYLYKTPKLNRAQFDVLLAKPEELLIIDVRRPDEVSKIGGFPVYLSVQAKQLDAALPFIPKERSIVTVSNHAGRAGAAGDFLADKGFKVVGAVGSQNYEEEGGKVTRIEPVQKKAK